MGGLDEQIESFLAVDELDDGLGRVDLDFLEPVLCEPLIFGDSLGGMGDFGSGLVACKLLEESAVFPGAHG